MSHVGSTDERQLVTAEGYEQLRSELQRLRREGRRAANEGLLEARADGDFDSNPALFDAIEEQTMLERRIAILEAQIEAARIVAPSTHGGAGIGSFVRVRELQSGEVAEYELVGAIESDVGNGRVSVGAPVGRALVDRHAGEIVEVETPRTTLQFQVLSVRPTASARTARKGGVTATDIPPSAPVATRAA